MLRRLLTHSSSGAQAGGAGRFLVLVITVLIVLIYAQVWNHEFLEYDDNLFLTENLDIQQGLNWESFKWAFTNNHAALWFPLLWLSHILDFHFFGMHSGWHHLHNLWLHWLNSVLLLIVLYRMTGRIWECGAVALLFAVHPQHVESVAWVTERKDTFSTVFFLLTIFFYHRYTLQRGPRRYLITIGVLVLGLMSKPMLVTLPFLLVLLDYWPLGCVKGCTWGPGDRTFGELLREKIPLFAVIMVVGVVTYLVGKAGGIVDDQDLVPLKYRLVNSLNSYFEYLRQFVWPNRLHAHYDFQLFFPWKRVLVAAVVLTGITIVAVRRRRSNPYILVGWLWYLGSLVPVLGLIQQGGHSMADRYTYVSMIGIYIIVIWSAVGIMKSNGLNPRLFVGTAALVFMGLTWAAHVQAGFWRDTETLFDHTLSIDQENDFALTKLGDLYKKTGRLDDAKKMYDLSIKLNPHGPASLNNLASIMVDEGEYGRAQDLYRRALAVTKNKSTVYYNMGVLFQRMGRFDEAVENYEKALELKVGHVDATTNLSLVFVEFGRYDEAIEGLESLLVSNPDDPLVRYNLACIYSRSDRVDQALHWLKEAVALGFDDWETLATDPDLARLRSAPGFISLGLPVSP
jgi:Flp pilus assembly protein TadD